LPEPVTSLAIESARRAAHAALAPPIDRAGQAAAIAALHRTIAFEAEARGVPLFERISGLTTALAADIANAAVDPSNGDAARALLRNAHQLAVSQLEILLALPKRAPAPTGE